MPFSKLAIRKSSAQPDATNSADHSDTNEESMIFNNLGVLCHSRSGSHFYQLMASAAVPIVQSLHEPWLFIIKCDS